VQKRTVSRPLTARIAECIMCSMNGRATTMRMVLSMLAQVLAPPPVVPLL